MTNNTELARMTVTRLLKKYTPNEILDLIDYRNDTCLITESYADALRWEIYQMRKKKSQFTKYRKFHPYQSKVIE